MGNKALSPDFWSRLGGANLTVGPCRTCRRFQSWDVLWWHGSATVKAHCEKHVLCHEPQIGCEDWEREPGSDDEEGTWPPVAPYRAPIAPPDTRSARERELQQMIDQQKGAGWGNV